MSSCSIGVCKNGLLSNGIAYKLGETTYENDWSAFIRLPFAT